MGRLALCLAVFFAFSSCEPIVLKSELTQNVSAYLASQLGTVETPTATVQGTLADAATGTYSSDALITLTTKTPDAQIHYTTDGTEPTESSPTTPNPVPLEGDGTSFTLKAIATKAGYQASSVFTAPYKVEYLLLATPIFSPPPGDYSSDTLISLTSTAGSTLRYTTDGFSTPTASFGNLYTGSFSLPPSATTTFRAIAYQTGWHTSRVATGTYTSHQAGTPDTAFGSSGDANGLSGSVTRLGVQSTGHIVGAGWNVWDRTTNGIYRRIMLTRSDSTGLGLDTGYLRYRESDEDLTGGKHDILTSDALAVAVQADDKVLVAGWDGVLDSPTAPTFSTEVWAVLRFAPNILTLDRKFDSFGATDPSRATAIVLDSQARVVVVGVNNAHVTIARYQADGTLDATFGTSGVGYTETTLDATPVAVILNSGAIKVVASKTVPGSSSVITAKFASDGSLDTTYGSSGLATVVLPNVFNTKVGTGGLTAAAGQTDGKIVFVGNSTADSDKDHPQLVGRLTDSGALDPTFGSGGYASGFSTARLPMANPFPTGFNVSGNVQWDEPRSVAISPSGKILVAGTTKIFGPAATPLNGTQFNLTRYTSNGALDTSFNGVTGYVLRAGVGLQDEWNDVLVQGNGEILVAGQRGYVSAGASYTVAYDLSLSRFW